MGSKNKKNGKHGDEAALDSASSESSAAGRSAGEPPRGGASYWLEQVDGEAERLRHRWNDAQSALDRCEARNRELESANVHLLAQVNDLQVYIDGRKEHWGELQKRVAQYEDTLAGMEQVVRDAEDKLAGKDGERELLSSRIIELERRCAELAGRLQERERADRDDERKLQRSGEELEQLRGQLARAELEAKEAAHEADERAKLCASLEVCVARRDKTIEELERNLQAHRDTAKGLDDEKLELNQRVARLELDLASQRGGSADEIRALRHELVAQERLIGTLETELEAKQKAIDALQRQESDAGSPPADAAAAPAANDAGSEDEHSDNVEIIRIGELFRHDAAGRQPIAVLEAPDGTTYPIKKPSVTIGRASSNDICIRREFISRTHARLIVRGIGTMIEDAGSKNGILVNCEPVGRRLLVDGDIVSFGGKLDLKYIELDSSAREGVPDPAESEAGA